MPLSLDDLYLSWQVIGEDGGQLRVYLLAVPRDLLDAQVLAIQAAGVRPHLMDLKPLALIRAVNQKDAIIADLEPDSLDVIIVVDDIPSIMRTIALSGDGVQEKVNRLAEELRRTIKFHNDSQKDKRLDPSTPVYVTGSLMGEAKVVEDIALLVERPVQRPNPPLECPPGMPVGKFMVNIGLALK
jgi:Tfp pilus assembly PilM family ATPase